MKLVFNMSLFVALVFSGLCLFSMNAISKDVKFVCGKCGHKNDLKPDQDYSVRCSSCNTLYTKNTILQGLENAREVSGDGACSLDSGYIEVTLTDSSPSETSGDNPMWFSMDANPKDVKFVCGKCSHKNDLKLDQDYSVRCSSCNTLYTANTILQGLENAREVSGDGACSLDSGCVEVSLTASSPSETFGYNRIAEAVQIFRANRQRQQRLLTTSFLNTEPVAMISPEVVESLLKHSLPDTSPVVAIERMQKAIILAMFVTLSDQPGYESEQEIVHLELMGLIAIIFRQLSGSGHMPDCILECFLLPGKETWEIMEQLIKAMNRAKVLSYESGSSLVESYMEAIEGAHCLCGFFNGHVTGIGGLLRHNNQWLLLLNSGLVISVSKWEVVTILAQAHRDGMRFLQRATMGLQGFAVAGFLMGEAISCISEQNRELWSVLTGGIFAAGVGMAITLLLMNSIDTD